MLLFELLGISSVIFHVVFLMLNRADGGCFLRRIVCVAIAAWMLEESCIRVYDFYDYNSRWHFFIGRIPLLVVVVWPVIIHCAWELASQLTGQSRNRVAFTTGAIVLTDAAFIEPVCVCSGFWTWHVPGTFDVPLIGIFGWGIFAFLCIFLIEAGKHRYCHTQFDLLLLVVPPVGTHLMLLISWWGAFRWVSHPCSPVFAAGLAWVTAFFLTIIFLKHQTRKRVDKKILLLRLPVALFFFALLGFNARDCVAQMVYATAFALPYLTLMWSPKTCFETPKKSFLFCLHAT